MNDRDARGVERDESEKSAEPGAASEEEKQLGTIESMKTKQYWMWVVPMGIAFAGLVVGLKAVGAPVWLAVFAGIMLNEVSEPYMNWLQEWVIVKKEVRQ